MLRWHCFPTCSLCQSVEPAPVHVTSHPHAHGSAGSRETGTVTNNNQTAMGGHQWRCTSPRVPRELRDEVLTLEHMPAHAGHPRANKMYTSMRRSSYWESMVMDVYSFVANCGTCAKGRVGARRRNNPLRLLCPQEPLSAVCLELLGPLPETATGNRYLVVMVDRFSKLTRVAPIPREDAETVASAFCDTWMASHGPPDTLLTDNGPQLTSTMLQGVCRMMGISNPYSTTYHPQTQGQVEQYIRTIMGQLKAYVEDHQDTWDALVSVLTLAYSSRPQQSTGVAPLEFVAPERVRTLAIERLTKDPYPRDRPRTAREAREHLRTHLRNLLTRVRSALATAQRRYKRALTIASNRLTRLSGSETGSTLTPTRTIERSWTTRWSAPIGWSRRMVIRLPYGWMACRTE